MQTKVDVENRKGGVEGKSESVVVTEFGAAGRVYRSDVSRGDWFVKSKTSVRCQVLGKLPCGHLRVVTIR